MAASERTYTIPLRRELAKVQKYKKAKKAVSAVREFVIRHSGSSDIRLGKHLNEKLWQHGIKNVPHFVKVNTTKDDKGTVTAELFGAPKEAKKAEPKKKAKTPAEKIAEKMQAIKPGKKEEEKKDNVKEAEVTATATSTTPTSKNDKNKTEAKPKQAEAATATTANTSNDKKSGSSINERETPSETAKQQ